MRLNLIVLLSPQLWPAEPTGMSLTEPLKDNCRTQLTLRIGPQQRHYITLPDVREREAGRLHDMRLKTESAIPSISLREMLAHPGPNSITCLTCSGVQWPLSYERRNTLHGQQ